MNRTLRNVLAVALCAIVWLNLNHGAPSVANFAGGCVVIYHSLALEFYMIYAMYGLRTGERYGPNPPIVATIASVAMGQMLFTHGYLLWPVLLVTLGMAELAVSYIIYRIETKGDSR